MDQLINQNLAEREQTRAALTHKLDVLESRLRESIDNVREAVRHSTDVPYQVKKRPWWMFGLSVLVGCAVGRMLGSGGNKIPRIQSSTDNVAREQYTQRVGVIKGATIGTMASIISELARHVIPALMRRIESSWQDKSTGEDVRKHPNVSALRR
jgi:ElaB/YqjD/DUF883 family membrane-anchored ribosome-binding protein